jgi:hypothetical protein
MSRVRGLLTQSGEWQCDCTPRLPAIYLQVKKENHNKVTSLLSHRSSAFGPLPLAICHLRHYCLLYGVLPCAVLCYVALRGRGLTSGSSLLYLPKTRGRKMWLLPMGHRCRKEGKSTIRGDSHSKKGRRSRDHDLFTRYTS